MGLGAWVIAWIWFVLAAPIWLTVLYFLWIGVVSFLKWLWSAVLRGCV